MTGYNSLRQTFDEVALLYNDARPCYPDELISTLIAITKLHKASTILEIGPGTGQATKPLAKQGFNITCIELGAALAEVAKYELQDYKNVKILVGAFEETTLQTESFDLVFAATAFHWIDPELKYLKTHRILKDKGNLAVIHTNHISDEKGDIFFKVSQSIYDRYDFTDKDREPVLPKNKDLAPSDVDKSLFKLRHFQLFPIAITYSANSYVRLLNTYSNHLVASKEVLQAFLDEIENLINNKFEGRIEKYFSMSLSVAQKI